MQAQTPDFGPALAAVQDYLDRNEGKLSPAEEQILLEVSRRLHRLESQAADLIEVNNRLWEKQGFDVSFDEDSDTIVFSFGGVEQRLKLNRADPDVPIKPQGLTSGSAYHAGKSEPNDEEEAHLRIELEEKIESYYQSAHRILKLFGRIPALSKIRCLPVTRVRNDLIEHPDDGALYSFGAGSSGPRVKPMHRGEPKFNDDGLVPNTENLLSAIVDGCGGAP